MNDDEHHEAHGAMVHRGLVEARTYAASGVADNELIALLMAASCGDPCRVKSIKERCSCAAQIAAAHRIQALMLEVDKLRAVMKPVTLRGLNEEASEN
jgi:hypothetical protein